MPNTKEKGKLIEVLSKHIPYGYATLCLIAEELMAEGVTFATDNNVGDKWISVKDRLPENGKKVLVYCKENKNDYEIGAYSDTYRGFFVRQTCYENITHWMPLPQPPKGE